MESLTNNVKIVRVLNAVAAGTSSQNSSVVDTQGYEAVTFVAAFGALTATQVTSVKVQQGTQAGGGDMTDLEGTLTGPLADGDGNKLITVEVIKPRERYVRAVINRGTANAVIDGVFAILTNPRVAPITQDSSVAFSERHASPAEGTA
ncbi:MAG: hypothetical protein LCH85_22185 [Chloroflexi bacterium]|nr:hypothetical protein [Chloroflexota bacterium]